VYTLFRTVQYSTAQLKQEILTTSFFYVRWNEFVKWIPLFLLVAKGCFGSLCGHVRLHDRCLLKLGIFLNFFFFLKKSCCCVNFFLHDMHILSMTIVINAHIAQHFYSPCWRILSIHVEPHMLSICKWIQDTFFSSILQKEVSNARTLSMRMLGITLRF